MKQQLEFISVSKKYGSHLALSKVSFSIRAGEHLAIVGSSGSGKSTALRLLAGFEIPDEGTIRFDEKLTSEPGVIRIAPHERGIAMVFQDLGLWPNLSVIENVILGLASIPQSKSEKAKLAHQALSICQIDELSARKPYQLSGGQQQRVALARALAAEPRWLLLDEPFSGLDLITKARLLRDISEIASIKKITVILVTHDPMEASSLCNRLIVLNDGHLQESGTFKELLEHPTSEILRVFRNQLYGVGRV
ncbi:MAG: ABC transporter ATP-binding protein [Bdellovibrionales bacterium]|nr:ABC transporter ATP-binding protein [Bdellovibrionales bacterium]